MIDIKIEDENVVITFPKEFLSIDYFSNIVKALEIEKTVAKSKLTEEKAFEMAEELKRKWWGEFRKNYKVILQVNHLKINAFDKKNIKIFCDLKQKTILL